MKRKRLKKLVVVGMAALMTLSQMNLSVFAEEMTQEATTKSSEGTLTEPTDATNVTQESVTVNSDQSSTQEKKDNPEEKQETENSQEPQVETKVVPTNEAGSIAVFNGNISLNGTDDIVEMNNYNSSKVSQTLLINLKFDNASTSKKAEITLANGLGFADLTGMSPTDADKNNWVFDMPVGSTYDKVITNAAYTPNEAIKNSRNQVIYQPKAGTVVYEFSPGQTEVTLSLPIISDRALNTTDAAGKIIDNAISVKQIEDEQVTASEVLEHYKLTTLSSPALYSNGSSLHLYLKPDNEESGTLTKKITDSNGVTSLQTIDKMIVDKLEYEFQFEKGAGIQDIRLEPAIEEFNVSFDRSNENYDYAYVTIDGPVCLQDWMSLSFDYKVAASTPLGSYKTTVTKAEITANGKTFEDTSNYTKEPHVTHVVGESDIKISAPTTNEYAYNSTTNEAGTSPLGGFVIVNNGGPSDEQKAKITFDDPSIGVQGVGLPFEENGTIKDIEVKTNKNQVFTIDQLSAEQIAQTYLMHKSIGFSRFELFLNDIGTVAADEHITEVTYNMGKIKAGAKGYGKYAGAENMKKQSQYALALAYYGKVLNIPASKTYSADATIVAADKEFSDASAVSATNEMTIIDAANITFANNANLNAGTATLTAGTTKTISGNLNISSYPYLTPAPSLVKGFDIYLRTANYLSINTNTISVTHEGQTYRVADGNLTVVPTVDNEGYPVYKVELSDVVLGLAKSNTLNAFSSIALTYDVKAKSSAPTVSIPLSELLYISARGLEVPQSNSAQNVCNHTDVYDVDGDGDVNEKMGTFQENIGLQIIEQRDFRVTTAANLNDGPWVSYDFDTNEKIIDLNPAGQAKYQLSVANNAGNKIDGFAALIPIPKEGEKTALTPTAPADFDPSVHLQKEAFVWTASLLKEIKPLSNSKLNYTILYATTYEVDKDSANFKTWAEIQDKNEIRMVKVATTDSIEDSFSESIEFPLALTDSKADLNAGKTNIYSARIYRKIEGLAAGYKPSEPIAIRLQTGVVSGQVFNDSNRNGVKDSNEAGQNGVTVHAYEAGTNTELEVTSTKTIHGVDGCYEFLGLNKLTNVDVVFDNPETKETIRFSPTTAKGSTATADAEHTKAVTANITPSGSNFDQINVGLITPVTITFNAGKGSTAHDTIQLFPNEKITGKPLAELTGNTFKDWYTKEDGGTKVEFPYTVGTKDSTFYARYEKNKYEVYYHNEGNETHESITYDDLLSKPANPNKTGQTFIGWFTAPTGGHAWNFAEDKMPAERLDLYARFGVATYKVTFDTGDQASEYAYEYDTLIEKPSTDPSKTGYTFEGWFTERTGGRAWNFTQDKMPSNDLTLYAHFSVNQYTVNYLVDKLSVKTVQVNYNTLITDKPTEPNKEGYIFEGWFNEASGEEWNFAKDKVPANDLNLTAHFKKNSYKLSFNNDGETVEQSVLFDDLVEEPTTPVKAGYTFDGWYDQATGGTKWDFITNRMPANNLTLYARYVINKYQVTFDDHGIQTTEEVEYNGLITKPTTDPQAPIGYKFIGWQAQGSDQLWDFANDKMPTNDIVLVAQFEALDQVITLDFDGGTSDGPNEITAPTDSKVDIDAVKTPQKPGYQFVGWFDGETQVSGTIIMPAGGLTLKAKWEETDQVIRFDANGGTGVDSIVAKTNATIMMEEFTTTRDGYEFIGWFDTNDQQVTGEFIVPAGGATFIAKWQALDQTITFDVNGGDSATQPEAIVQPTDTKVKLDEVAKPKKSGYTFAGWADKTGKKYAGTITMPAGGLTLLAQWEEEPAAPVTKPKDNTSTNNNGNNNYKTNQTLSKKQSTEKSLPNSGEKTSPVIELIGLVVMFGVLALVVLQRSQKLNNKK
ncbi:InlB B-repeat-containing protein [Enterococcus sp. UD-01]|uniref:InlB B-repeat-containing protein n=1 Tax=Enterococcus sp. UD-01 TaxID=3373911 RepID=UPI003839BB35